jgi:DNA-binding Lrp family transcriptional regulator
MKEEGPRNLQNIARASKIPYTTVYSRVTKLEREGLLSTRIHPNYSRIGLTQANIYATPFPGRELLAREALKIPDFWLKMARCIGECNGYFSTMAIPSANTKDFEEYLDQLVARGIIRNVRISWLGESISPVPNFDYYDLSKKAWKFEWKDWLSLFKRRDRHTTKSLKKATPSGYDKRDLIILKELYKNARITLADLAKMLSITLPAAKYRFEGLLEKGLIEDYIINILPFAADVSDLSELRLDIKDEGMVKNIENAFIDLPFVLTYAPIRGLNSITARVYVPRVELNNLFTFLSDLVKQNVLTSYSYLQLDAMTLQAQTFSYGQYTDGSGWKYDNRKYLDQVENLVSNWPGREAEPLTVRTGPAESMQ